MARRAPGATVLSRKWWTEDKDGRWEHRESTLASAECPRCRQAVELTAETDGWVEHQRGSREWRHDGYGPAMGECCGLLIADWWEGTFSYELPEQTPTVWPVQMEKAD